MQLYSCSASHALAESASALLQPHFFFDVSLFFLDHTASNPLTLWIIQQESFINQSLTAGNGFDWDRPESNRDTTSQLEEGQDGVL